MTSIADNWRLQREAPSATEEALRPYIWRHLDEIRELPTIDEMISAVYFIFDGDELVYVGASAGVANRLSDHYRARHFGRSRFTHIAVLPVPDNIKFTVELHYIERFTDQ